MERKENAKTKTKCGSQAVEPVDDQEQVCHQYLIHENDKMISAFFHDIFMYDFH